jgi:succinate-acetate transporter protein
MNKLANPAPLGLIGFATTTWLLSMINAGWLSPDGEGIVLAMAFAMGGSMQLLAGIMEYARGNTFGFTAFNAYGAFWWSYALFVIFFSAKVPGVMVGWYLLLWGIFTFYMWIGTLKLGGALQLVFLALWLTFVVLAIGAFAGSSGITHVGGYLGLITAILAGYTSAAQVLNEVYGRTVLPA